MRIVPQAFYQNPSVSKILVDELCAVIHKKVSTVDLNNERFLASHAITIVLNGQLKIEAVDKSIELISSGEMTFLPKGLYMISDIMPLKGDFEAIVYFIDEDLMSTFLAETKRIDFSSTNNSSPICLPYHDSLRQFTDNLISLYGEQGNKNKKLTRLKLLEFLHLLSNSPTGDTFLKTAQSISNRTKMSITTFMQENYSKPLSIEDYAYLTGRSISTFRRDFKSKFDVSPKQWLIEKRLEKAYQLLKDDRLSVTEAAYRVGHDNISHFIKSFRKKYGLSPKQHAIKSRQSATH